MRIGIDITKAVSRGDGIGNYVYSLTRALTEIDSKNEYFLYDLLHPIKSTAFDDTFPELPMNFVSRIGCSPCDDGLDVFHATAWALPPTRAGRLVFTCYDLTFLSHPEFHDNKNKLHCINGTLRAIVRGAHFIAISRYTRARMLELLGLGTDRIDVIHLGADERFQPGNASESQCRLRKKYGIQRPFILTVGTIEPRKNQLALIQAYKRLPRKNREKIELVLAGGEGWLNAPLYDYLRENPDIQVRLLGRVGEEDLVDLYRACLFFAYPSIAEGFGLPVLEAMQCGTAVLTSSSTSIPEVAGNAALLVDPDDPSTIVDGLSQLLTQPPLIPDLRSRAKQQAREFSWKRTAKETFETYSRLSGASPRHPGKGPRL